MVIKIVANEVEHFTAIMFSLHFIRAFKLMAISREPVFRFMFQIVFRDRCAVNLIYRFL